MTEHTFTLGMGQMRVDGGKPERNLERAVAMVREASQAGCRYVVLPECLDVGWTHPAARELAEPIPGPRSGELARAAKQHRIHVAAGLTERAGRRVYNAAILIGPDGQLLAKHRKVNILDIARKFYSVGDRLEVAETAEMTVGMTICADNFRSSLALGHVLARMGAQLILSPSAWAVDADHDNDKQPYGRTWEARYRALTTLYDITLVGVSNVGWIDDGPWKGRQCIGCSLAMGPGGEVLARGPYGAEAEELVVVTVRPRPPAATGTDVAAMLKDRGYDGP